MYASFAVALARNSSEIHFGGKFWPGARYSNNITTQITRKRVTGTGGSVAQHQRGKRLRRYAQRSAFERSQAFHKARDQRHTAVNEHETVCAVPHSGPAMM